MLDVKRLITKILTNATYVVDSHPKNNVSIAAQGNIGNTYTATKSGYYPVCIAGFNSSSTYCAFGRLYLSNQTDGSCTVNYGLNNASSSSRSTNLTVYILWRKLGG